MIAIFLHGDDEDDDACKVFENEHSMVLVVQKKKSQRISTKLLRVNSKTTFHSKLSMKLCAN